MNNFAINCISDKYCCLFTNIFCFYHPVFDKILMPAAFFFRFFEVGRDLMPSLAKLGTKFSNLRYIIIKITSV
jgi:hypothetical protein